ncbi:hypothetical protein V7S43_017351 [Phytophthora oleae]|uniref:Armadillo repeat-containing domain-containing protein n=1 Tax=Phytophthora oleae TaxID=2107226 RepID=A0ABD3ETE8_9STRA
MATLFHATCDSPTAQVSAFAMDACIARGGISHVLSQARASLKNPSRPFTPQNSSRPLFHGDDYRPGSRPSSSYTVAELELLAQLQVMPSVPKPSKLPPRPRDLKARPPARPQPHESASTGTFKLVHAPVLSDDESGDDLSTVEADEPQETQFDLEASLSLPSNEELVQSYDSVERCFNDLLSQDTGSPDFFAGVGQLRELLDSFVDLSAFLQTGGKSREVQDDAKLRRQLFDKLVRALLEKWPTNAMCALELAPSLLALYCTAQGSSDDGDRARAQVTKLGKTLFVLSKDSDNDSCFCNVRYVEAILHAIADTSDQASGHRDDKHSKDSDDAIFLSTGQETLPLKTLIYAAGTLKNISNAEDKMARLLATNRAIAILSETMLWRSEDAANSKEVAQFLIQTTGILRNLSVSKSNQKQFLEAHIPLRLCGMIPAFLEHQELMVNISRILSKLTLHELPRAQINQSCANLQNLVAVIDHRQNPSLSLLDQERPETRSQDLLFVRVFFVLGNLCAGNDQNRQLIANFSGVSILLKVLQFYGSRYSNARRSKPLDDEKEEHRRVMDAEQAMEVLIKLVRVIANVAINAEVGALLNENEGLTPLLDILDVAQRVGDEELMLNAVSCITNVSYYSSNSKRGQNDEYCFIENDRLAITRLLSRILLDRNEEAVVEAARAFGNLSRFQDVLVFMAELKVLDCLVVLLDHSNREVVYTVCGVLMNAALDHKTREGLLSVRPTGDNEDVDVRSLLGGVVECAAADDFDMTLIASKALYNLLLSKTAQGNFSATSLRDTIEEILRRISHHVERGNSKEVSEPNEDEDEEVADSWSSRQELRLVLPQLLRSVNSLLETM